MPRKTHNELVAGIFVVVLLALTLGVVLWIGASGIFKKSLQRAYFTVDMDMGEMGLAVGSSVRINDFEVGKISDVQARANEHRTLYIADIESEQGLLQKDARVRVDSGFLGASALVITDKGKDPQRADEKNPVAISGGGITQAFSNLALATEKLKVTLDEQLDPAQKDSIMSQVKAVLADVKTTTNNIAKMSDALRKDMDVQQQESLLARIHKSVEQLNAITGNIEKETRADVKEALIARVHVAVEDIVAILADARPKLDRTFTAVAEATETLRDYTKKDVAELLATLRESNTEILKITKNFAVVSEQTRQMVAVNRDNVDSMLGDMARVASNLKATSADLRRSPWKLLYTPKPGEVAAENRSSTVRDFESGAAQLNQVIAKLKALAAANPQGLPADDPELKKIREQLLDTYSKFNAVEQALWKEFAK